MREMQQECETVFFFKYRNLVRNALQKTSKRNKAKEVYKQFVENPSNPR